MKTSELIRQTLDRRVKEGNIFHCPLCDKFESREDDESECGFCPLIMLEHMIPDETMYYDCPNYSEAAAGDSDRRSILPRWEEDILELALASEMAGD